MKKSIFAVVALFGMVTLAQALPNLQVYSPGATAGDFLQDQDTWFSSTNPFDITVVGAMGKAECSLTNVYLLFSVLNGQTGTIKVNNTLVNPIYTTKAAFAAAAGVSPLNTFNNHYPLQDNVSDFLIFNIGNFSKIQASSTNVLHDYNAETGDILAISSGQTYGQEKNYNISFAGFTQVHVDAFGFLDTKTVDTWTTNPGSHDTTNNTPVPEPGTMMLLGVGMFGLAIFGKRRMNKES